MWMMLTDDGADLSVNWKISFDFGSTTPSASQGDFSYQMAFAADGTHSYIPLSAG